MADITEVLRKASDILDKSIILISEKEVLSYPADCSFGLTMEELRENSFRNYKGYNIYSQPNNSTEYYICIKADAYENSEAIKLLLLNFENVFYANNSPEECIRRIISKNQRPSDIHKLQQFSQRLLNNNIVLIEEYNKAENLEDIFEIIRNTITAAIMLEHDNKIFILLKEEDIKRACEELQENLLTELYMECTVIIGKRLGSFEELLEIYDNCLEMSYLRKKFKVESKVISSESMDVYKTAASLNNELYKSIMDKVFTPKFRDILNKELETTIEKFFDCNLNLTDTANKLYIHRNTLLYRLDKIYKITGYDLRKFEDSWIFKLAWILNKKDLL